ncbi:MAG: MBL fold metallo-hydrolase, partial [Verrucomicrobia bacterium]|nr:MBL fold metallo-hydrolase [Verrucomicrobiota bacterium]
MDLGMGRGILGGFGPQATCFCINFPGDRPPKNTRPSTGRLAAISCLRIRKVDLGRIRGDSLPATMELNFDRFTGGLFETNCYYLRQSKILVDAPEGAAAWLRECGYPVAILLLTHGHVDHVWDAAQIQREHGCKVYYHPETAPMVLDPGFYRRFGLPWEVQAVQPGIHLSECPAVELGGQAFEVLEVPGHCPGSLCFLIREANILFGGDVLFAGAVGRWDLPGGNKELLLDGIRKKLLPLGDGVRVLSG